MTKSQDAPSSRAELRRQSVIDAARELFVRQGFHQTGMAQISEASGVRVGQIYRDFAGKEDVIAAICAQDVKTLLNNKRLFDRAAEGEALGLAAWIDEYVAQQPTIDQCRILAEIGAEAGRNRRVAELIQNIEAQLKPNLAQALAALAPSPDAGGLREQLVEIMYVINLGAMVQRAINPEYDATVVIGRTMALIREQLERLTHP